jgi:arginase family enzyme
LELKAEQGACSRTRKKPRAAEAQRWAERYSIRSASVFETIILDVDGGVTSQEELLSRYDGTIIPLQERTGDLRFWCHKDEMQGLKRLVSAACRTKKPKAIFYGSGDFHHLAYLGISLIDEPVTVIHFDNHSDFWREEFVNLLALGKWNHCADYFNYGSWVIPALRLPFIKKVVQFGIDGDFKMGNYLFFPKGRMTHAFDLLLQGRIETYPNFMNQSTLFGRLSGSLSCVDFKPGIFTTNAMWKNMNEHGGVQAIVEAAVLNIPTEAVYITIDKDVLSEKESFSAYPGFTGQMRLNELLNALAFIGERKRVVGLDVCGDASSFEAIEAIQTFTKKTMAHRQYGRFTREQFSSTANIKMNESVNLHIMGQFVR